jgi:hypothetical protein
MALIFIHLASSLSQGQYSKIRQIFKGKSVSAIAFTFPREPLSYETGQVLKYLRLGSNPRLT